MQRSRRLFLAQCATLTAGAAVASPLKAHKTIINGAESLFSAQGKLIFYYTSDINGRVDPVTDNMGGLYNIKVVLNAEKRGLVLDAGGFMSGSQNLSSVTSLARLMNSAGYQAVGLSEREFIGGESSLLQFISVANFSLINCNHAFTGELSDRIKPYHIFKSGGVRIGVTGVCKDLKKFKYSDPLKSAEETAAYLKNKEKCDFVICLSHLGEDSEGQSLGNNALAAGSEHIDMVIGGGNEIVRSNDFILLNKQRREVILSRPASHGLMVGKAVVSFDRNNHRKGLDIYPIVPNNQVKFKSIAKIREIKAELTAV